EEWGVGTQNLPTRSSCPKRTRRAREAVRGGPDGRLFHRALQAPDEKAPRGRRARGAFDASSDRGCGWPSARSAGSDLAGESGIDDPALLDLVEQRLVADAQLVGRLALVPGGALEHGEHRVALGEHRGALADVLEGHLALRHRGRRRRRLWHLK